MEATFPHRTVAGKSLSCMIAGTNWILGYSDTSPAADDLIRHRNGNREADEQIARSAGYGGHFCFPDHSSAEQLVNKDLRAIPRFPDYLDMIRSHGMIPGLSAHMPELVVYSDANEYDVETDARFTTARASSCRLRSSTSTR